MVQYITRYKWYYKEKEGADEYSVYWKNPLGTIVCSMDLKVVGEEQLVLYALSQAAEDLKAMNPTVFVDLNDNEDAVEIIDNPSFISEEETEINAEETIIVYEKGGMESV